MKNHTFGVAPHGAYYDVSRTERGAKNYATRHGYNAIFIRFDGSMIIALRAEKIGKKWKAIK